MLISGLNDAERQVLDAYESTDYRLAAITVDGQRRCLTYVWRHGVMDDDWDAAAFAATHLDDYVRRCRRWRAGYLPQPTP
jgi:hypothetical protein